jgi:hypothetical protein
MYKTKYPKLIEYFNDEQGLLLFDNEQKEIDDIVDNYLKEQLTLTDVGSSNSVKETVKNFADIDMFLNDINNDSFDKNDKGLGKVSRIANKYIIKLR